MLKLRSPAGMYYSFEIGVSRNAGNEEAGCIPLYSALLPADSQCQREMGCLQFSMEWPKPIECPAVLSRLRLGILRLL